MSVFHTILVGALVGTACGSFPLVTGAKRNRIGLALGGFFICVIYGVIGGIILGIPCAVFCWWIIKKAENKAKEFPPD